MISNEMLNELIKIYFISFWLVRFEPIEWLIGLLKNGALKAILTLLFGCHKCLSFWMTLMMLGLYPAALMFFVVYWLDKL